jgi:hypothetical protein
MGKRKRNFKDEDFDNCKKTKSMEKEKSMKG